MIIYDPKFVISKMKNVLMTKCSRLIPLGYLIIQTLILLSIYSLQLSFKLHVCLLVIATLSYFAVTLKNPGYVNYDKKKKKSIKSSKIITPQKVQSLLDSPKQLDLKDFEIKDQIKQNSDELGLESKIKQEQGSQNLQQKQKKELSYKNKSIQKQQCIIEGEIGKGLVVNESQGFSEFPLPLKFVNRWCQQCKGEQDLRVRHCYQCGRCIRTFDHHCPWINNCIGEKNKIFLLIYLLFQIAQLIVIAFDLGLQLISQINNTDLVLWITIVSLCVMAFGILSYQVLMISLNITTWERLRWSRIQYLTIFSQKQLVSLFDRGLKSNLMIFLKGSCTRQGIKWKQHINTKANNCIINAKSGTDRRLITDNKS